MFDFMLYPHRKRKEDDEKKQRQQGFRIMRTRRLMQAITSRLELTVGDRIPEKYIIDAIIQIRGIDHKRESTTTKIWLNRLLRLGYIHKYSYNMVWVIDTGESWFDNDWSEIR